MEYGLKYMWSPEPCNLDKNEPHRYFLTIFTTDFRTAILCRTIVPRIYDVNRRKKCLKFCHARSRMVCSPSKFFGGNNKWRSFVSTSYLANQETGLPCQPIRNYFDGFNRAWEITFFRKSLLQSKRQRGASRKSRSEILLGLSINFWF